jgi:hypothetical protein
MFEAFTTIVVYMLQAYAALGLLFALVFLVRGLELVDAAAHGTGPGFRLLLIPGVVAFWPLLLQRWCKAGQR